MRIWVSCSLDHLASLDKMACRLHVCFARVFLCKGRKAPLATPGMFTNLLGSVSTFLVVKAQEIFLAIFYKTQQK